MAQENSQNMEVVMGIIMQAGNGKAAAMQAIQAAKKGDFEKADDFIHQANEALVNAHNVQTDMLTKEAQGDHVKVDLYMVHAQDHLMTAITFIDLAKEVVDVYKKLAEEK
ncbi:PTS lactose/cellobiose transporter subunit IIA [uncultured Lactobacillus sp.]|uniref:PTS lactose/cellobiose transporter subunit IIA n=1 Tax=uncultured Lactobacillus sp. TaxID=153152 RepID=UPI00260695BC|nr:PTS lactose/cellobiose transporter subunit IIA [uncultured Lactobacillus sp.]